MSDILLISDEVVEGTDNWNLAQVAVRREGFDNPVLLLPDDVVGPITLNVYLPASSTPVYATTFSKNLAQPNGITAIHLPVVDGRWDLDDIGPNFEHKIQVADLVPVVLEGGRTYTFVYQIPTADDGNVPVIFEWDMRPLH